MKDVLTYKDFIGSVHFSAEDAVFHGKIEGITDLVTFEGQSVKELVKAFHEAVDDYLALCKETGKEPLKSCKGSFNVRVPSELHIIAMQQATRIGISLNQFVQKALEKAVIHPLMAFKNTHKPRTKRASR
jgi:predicted HicB family RNase H-like nuclease